MNRREFVLAMAAMPGAMLPLWASARAAPSRVAYLSLALPDADRSWLQAFKAALAGLGYELDKNLVLDIRHAAGHADRLPRLADELLAAKPQVLVVYGAWHIPEKLRGGTPVVFTVVPDPVAQGVVRTLARPGGNLTGFSDAHAELVPKRLELIKEMAPTTARVGVLYFPSSMTTMQLDAAQAAATAQGMTLIPAPVKGPDPNEVQRAFSTMTGQQASAVLVLADQTVFANRRLIADLAIKSRCIVISTVREWADAGFTMSYGADFHDLWRRSAVYVDKILKGAKPGELPVEQPTKFDLVINRKSARAIGIDIPRALLLRADHIIE